MKDVLTPATPDGIRVGLNAPGLDKAATIADPVSLPPVGALPADLKAVVPKDGVGANDVGGPPEGEPLCQRYITVKIYNICAMRANLCYIL
jgi:hypothetical protein